MKQKIEKNKKIIEQWKLEVKIEDMKTWNVKPNKNFKMKLMNGRRFCMKFVNETKKIYQK